MPEGRLARTRANYATPSTLLLTPWHFDPISFYLGMAFLISLTGLALMVVFA